MNGIPDGEYRTRMRRLQRNVRDAGLDAVLVHGNEADFANVRYLSEYWPTFESAGVFVPAREYEAFVAKRGFKKYMLYGPCHGIGMMEVERPWMESTSDYALAENMTFQVDTFFYDKDFGLRWENGVRVTERGVEKLSRKYMRLVRL
jgi:Xaa-Pro aminopeptidase